MSHHSAEHLVECPSSHETRRILPNEAARHTLRARAESSVHTHQTWESFAGAVRRGLLGHPVDTAKAAGRCERRGSPKRAALGRGTKAVTARLMTPKRTPKDIPIRPSVRGTLGLEVIRNGQGYRENAWMTVRLGGASPLRTPLRPRRKGTVRKPFLRSPQFKEVVRPQAEAQIVALEKELAERKTAC